MKIYLLGDSLSTPGQPGHLLAVEELSKKRSPYEVTIDAKVSRSAPSLLKEWPRWAIRAPRGQDLAIVFLGANDTGQPLERDREAWRRVRDVLASVAPRVVVLGPPAFPARAELQREVPRVLATQQAVFGRENVRDLQPLTRDVGRTRDGVHFAPEGARVVASRLVQLLAPELDGASRGGRRWGLWVAGGLLALASLVAGSRR